MTVMYSDATGLVEPFCDALRLLSRPCEQRAGGIIPINPPDGLRVARDPYWRGETRSDRRDLDGVEVHPADRTRGLVGHNKSASSERELSGTLDVWENVPPVLSDIDLDIDVDIDIPVHTSLIGVDQGVVQGDQSERASEGRRLDYR